MTKFFHNLFFYVLYQPLLNVLIFLAWLVPGHSLGWAIILLTIIIRLILVPTTNQMMDHQRSLRSLQPKINELKEKHKDDQAAHSKAVMELYSAEKVSPFGGCLSSFVQLPLLLVMYSVFRAGLTTGYTQWLYSFIPHFTINTRFFGLDLTKPEVWVLPIVVAILQYFQVRQTTSMSEVPGQKTDPNDPTAMTSKMMVYLVPILIWSVARRVPAALGLYYATFSVFLIIQQTFYIRRVARANAGQTEGKAVTTSPIVADETTSSKPEKKAIETTKKGDVTVTVRRKDGGDK